MQALLFVQSIFRYKKYDNNKSRNINYAREKRR